MGLKKKKAFFASCSSSRGANVAVELDSIFASGKNRESEFEKVDLVVHGKMSFFFFSTKYRISLITPRPCLVCALE